MSPEDRAILERIVALGCHLMPLKSGIKIPSRDEWQLAPAMTLDEAVAHVDAGGNLGIHLGFSGLIALDAENELATRDVMAAGLQLTVAPAKSRVAGNPKHHGSHTWLRVPEGIDPTTLTSHGMQVTLPGGGLIDVLAGGKQAVVPPSRLDDAPGWAYSAYAGSPLDLAVPLEEAEIATAPLWLFDATLPCPPQLAPLRGALAPRVRRDLAELDARSIELTAAIDQVPWVEWIAADPRLSPTGQVDGCGCEVWHWAGADHDKSATLHEDCAQGSGAHIWSGTMQSQLGLGEHVSRLNLACALRGESRSRVAASVGIRLGGEQELDVIDADNLDEKAEEAEAAGQDTLAASYREAAEVMRSRQHAVAPKDGAVLICADSVVGAPLPAVEAPATAAESPAGTPETEPAAAPAPEAAAPSIGTLSGPGSGPSEQASPEPKQAEAHLGWGDEDEEIDNSHDNHPVGGVVRKQGELVIRSFPGVALDAIPRPRKDEYHEYPMPPIPAHVPPVQGAKTHAKPVLPPLANRQGHENVHEEWIFSATPGLSHIAAAADSRAVSRWGLLGTLLPRIAATIPPTVRLIPANRATPTEPGPTSAGTSINLYSVVVSPPASGKTDTMSAASALIPGVRTVAPGTGEGVLKEFPRLDTSADDDDDDGDGGPDSAPALSAIDNGIERYPGSVLLESDEIDVFVGEMMRQGSKTNGWYRSMWMGGEIGNTASDRERRSLIAAHTYRFGIVLGAQPNAVSQLFGETGRGTPQRFMWLPAHQSARRGEQYPPQLGTAPVYWFDGRPSMIPETGGQRPPVWIRPPKAAIKDMDIERARAATANPFHPSGRYDEDDDLQEGTDPEAIANRHAVLQQLKVAVILAVLDGLDQPQDAHWFAAGAIMTVRRRTIEHLVAISERIAEGATRKRGRDQGVANAHARAANERETRARRDATSNGVVTAAMQLLGKGKPITVNNLCHQYESGGHGSADFVPEVVNLLLSQGTLRQSETNPNELIPAMAAPEQTQQQDAKIYHLPPAPKIGGLGGN